ncbi:putative olfactory receptor 2B8 [Spea bombifrons]|uniref:putative olfactory receptor 2B8 n=1 Tax=Spea bombifrons TaxID=233779 RepID=UPI00234B8808|nr:putative olfactory receptor 2B8 [Spea bombifrons]
MAWNNDTAMSEFILLGLSGKPKTRVILFMVFLIFYLIILIGNTLIILLTTREKSLQTPMYFFLTNLSVMDVWVSSTIIPRMLNDLTSVKKTISYTECITQMYVSLSLGKCECILLAIMAYDRYIAICYPLHYNEVINRPVCIRLAAGTWICGFLLSIPHIALTLSVNLCGHNEINHFLCEVPEFLSMGCENITIAEFVIFIVGVIILIIPVIVISLSYVQIILSILKIASFTGQQKAFSTCGSHMIVVTLFYGSAMAAYMKPRSYSSPDTDKMITIFYFIITPMLNPMIYTLRNKEVKSALKKFRHKHTFCVPL